MTTASGKTQHTAGEVVISATDILIRRLSAQVRAEKYGYKDTDFPCDLDLADLMALRESLVKMLGAMSDARRALCIAGLNLASYGAPKLGADAEEAAKALEKYL